MWVGLLLNMGVELGFVENRKQRTKMGQREDERGGRRWLEGVGDTGLSLGMILTCDDAQSPITYSFLG